MIIISDTLLLLPTLNEEEAIQAIAPEIPGDFDVLVVDGGSTDRTVDMARKLGFECITQKFGKGKGCGVRSAMEYFQGSGHKYLAMIDADYTNDPGEIKKMLKKMGEGGYDIVLGSRDRKLQRELLGRFSLFINWSTSSIVSLAYNNDLPDVQSSYWVYNRKAVETLYPLLTATGFEIEYDMIYHSWKEGLKVGHQPVYIRTRLGKSKFTNYLRLKQIYHGLTYVKKSLWIMFMSRPGNSCKDSGSVASDKK